jgi:hypothetical protein
MWDTSQAVLYLVRCGIGNRSDAPTYHEGTVSWLYETLLLWRSKLPKIFSKRGVLASPDDGERGRGV